MAPLIGKDMSEAIFLERFASLCVDPLFHVRKVCAANFGDFSSVVGMESTEKVLVRNKMNCFSFVPFFHFLSLPFSCPSSSTCVRMVFGVFARPAPTCSCPSPASAHLASASPNYLPSSPTCSRTSRDGYA